MFLAAIAAEGQTGKPVLPLPPGQPTVNPNQLPNTQSNSSYENNSMQNNKPSNPNPAGFQGNGNYTDPTKNPPAPTLYNSNMDQLPATTPVNTNGSNNFNHQGVDVPNPTLDRR